MIVYCDKCGTHFREMVDPCPICEAQREFRDNLIKKQEDIPPEFSETVDKYFWELI